MNPFVAGGLIALSFGAWGWAQPWLAKRRYDRHRAELSRAPLDVLVTNVKEALGLEGWGWEEFPVAREILATDRWTEQTLHDALDELARDVCLSDKKLGRNSRDGYRFHFYDCGLAYVREVLSLRLKR